MSMAMASATELLASHCVEIAQLAGAGREQVGSVIRSAVDVRTPGDLITMTAAAATALRGATTLKARAHKEGRNNAAVIPFEKEVGPTCHLSYPRDMEAKCRVVPREEGKLLKRTRKGLLRWKESQSMSTRSHKYKSLYRNLTSNQGIANSDDKDK